MRLATGNLTIRNNYAQALISLSLDARGLSSGPQNTPLPDVEIAVPRRAKSFRQGLASDTDHPSDVVRLSDGAKCGILCRGSLSAVTGKDLDQWKNA